MRCSLIVGKTKHYNNETYNLQCLLLFCIAYDTFKSQYEVELWWMLSLEVTEQLL